MKSVKEFLRNFGQAWTWRMAWRDSRSQRVRLLLLSSSIVLGVAALAAIGSLGRNLERAVDEQAKTLLGADLEISSRLPFSAAEEKLLTGVGGEQSRQVSFSSMIYFPHGGGTRLAQLRALGGPFPFYGKIETVPPSAAEDFKNGRGALVEENLLLQFDAKVGDSVRVGKLNLPIIGALKKVPGESAALAVVSPRVYLPLAELPQTALLDVSALARYQVFFRLPPMVDATKLVERMQPQLDHFRLSAETAVSRQRDLGRAMDNLYRFLNLTALVALILGGIGVASAVHVHVKQKLSTVALLRCLGASIGQAFAIYLVQGAALGVVGALAGSLLGVAVQSAVPRVVADFIPFAFVYHTAWPAIAAAAGTGFVLCLLFALLPLLEVRRVSPLTVLRRYSQDEKKPRDGWRWVVLAALAAVVFLFAQGPGHQWTVAAGFCGGLAAALLILAGIGWLLIAALRRRVPAGWPYTLRQGLANLHRPNNRTLLLLLSLGLGVFLMVTIQLLQHTLLSSLMFSDGASQPNTVLFDIQPAQQTGVAELVRGLGLPVLEEVPIVTMRLSSVKGRPVEELLAEKKNPIPTWELRREYRSTYTGQLNKGEKIVAGQWVGQADASNGPVPISVEKEIAHDLGVGLGDRMVFDVQGVPMEVRVASLREVNWRRMQPSFFMLFPRGVLEGAPHMGVLASRVPSVAQSALLQRRVVEKYPNISVIDLTLILQTLDSILSKVSFVIQFMALFTLFTGIIVLTGTLVSGHFQRVRESVLLRTLGAARGQIFRILAVEYFSLGALAAALGCGLAWAGVWLMARLVFHIPFAPSALPVLVAAVATPALTTAIGLLLSRTIFSQPPLAILRSEGSD